MTDVTAWCNLYVTFRFLALAKSQTSLTSNFGSIGQSEAVFPGITPFPKRIQAHNLNNWALQTHHKYSPKFFITILLAFLTFICQHFEIFLLKFQGREPVIHVLYTALLSVTGIDAEVRQEETTYIGQYGENFEISYIFYSFIFSVIYIFVNLTKIDTTKPVKRRSSKKIDVGTRAMFYEVRSKSSFRWQRKCTFYAVIWL